MTESKDINSTTISNEKIIHESDQSIIYHNPNDTLRKTVVKQYKSNTKNNSKIDTEYNAYSALSHNGVPEIIDRIVLDDKEALVLSLVDGISIKQAYREEELTIPDFLTLALHLTRMIGNIHDQGWNHYGLNPNHILLAKDHSLHIVGWDCAHRFRYRATQNNTSDLFELAFQSPEQTGMVNTDVDHRSDIYSLGLIFYYLLTGQSALESNMRADLMAQICSGRINRPSEIRFDIPSEIEGCIMGMIARDKNERYGSIEYVHEQLDIFNKDIHQFGTIRHALESIRTIYKNEYLNDNVVGRHNELRIIGQSLERARMGTAELILISGPSGQGKTSLVNEVSKSIVDLKGMVLRGRFDQINNQTIHSGLNSALKSHLEHITQLAAPQQLEWRDKIRTVLGDYGSMFTHVFPQLVDIIGETNAAITVDTIEYRNRYNYIYKELLKVFTSIDRPMVIILDNLQWADPSSVEFISWLFQNRDINHLSLIATYQSDIGKVGNYITELIDSIESQDIHGVHIHLDNLTKEEVKELVISTAGRIPHINAIVNLLIDNKIKNPLYVKEVLRFLVLSNYTSKDENNDAILEKALSNNLDQHIEARILNLDEDERTFLRVVAHLGTSFNLQEATITSAVEKDRLNQIVNQLEAKDLLIKENDSFRLVHDKIQEKAAAEAYAIRADHFYIDMGQSLLRSDDNEIFRTASLLNKAQEALSDEAKKELLQLNYEAGMIAKASNSHYLSYSYLKKAIDQLNSNSWIDNYNQTLLLFTEYSESALLQADYEAVHHIADIIISNASEPLDKVAAYQNKMLALAAQSEHLQCDYTAKEALKMLDFHIPASISTGALAVELGKTMYLMRNVTLELLKGMREMTSPRLLAIIKLLYINSSTAYIIDQKKMVYIHLKQIQLTLKHGVSAETAPALSGYGLVLAGGLGKQRKGSEIGKWVMELVQSTVMKKYRSTVYYGTNTLLNVLTHPVRDNLENLKKAIQYGLEDGNHEHASFPAYVLIAHKFILGFPLPWLKEEAERYLDLILPLQQLDPIKLLSIKYSLIYNLSQDLDEPTKIDNAYISQEQLEAGLDDTKYFLTNSGYIMTKGILLFYNRDFKQSFVFFNQVQQYWDLFKQTSSRISYSLFKGLAAASCIEGKISGKRKYKKALKVALADLEALNKLCPENFANKYELLKAETHRVNGKNEKARFCYERAITISKANKYIHEEALAHEQFASHCYNVGQSVSGAMHIMRAYQLYEQWGAIMKTTQLKRRFPEALSKVGKTAETDLSLDALLNAAHMLTNVKSIDSLKQNILELVVNYFKSSKAALVLERDNKFFIEVSYNESFNLHNELLLSESDLLPVGVINGSARTQTNIVANTELEVRQCSSEVYFDENEVKSLLCLPLLSHNKLTGVLYLENNVEEEAYKESAVNIIRALGNQLAGTIENAMIRRSLEQRVIDRTKDLQEKTKQAELLLHNVLPESITRELNKEGRIKPKRYENVTVLFTDFVDFSILAEKVSEEELIEIIDFYFDNYDRIIEEYGLEKIKTIGDSYMCTSGLPIYTENSTLNAVKAAFEIQAFMKKINEQGEFPYPVGVRLGMCTGPVIAGVVGRKKYAFDIWGDTVNTASRMESSGRSGMVNIAESTYQEVKNKCITEYRGEVDAKNKGKIKMYWVTDIL